jgi:undecaprenyl-diphosphatase
MSHAGPWPAGGLAGLAALPGRFAGNVASGLSRLMRPARRPAPWINSGRWLALAVLLTATILAVMVTFDAKSVAWAQTLPNWFIDPVNEFTDFGKAVWVLVPFGVALIGIGVLAHPGLPLATRAVLAALSVRFGYVFLAVAVPGIFVTVIKRLIGRARPLVEGTDVFVFAPGWRVEYASLPSGHATTAFAAAFAVGMVWPRLRPWMWTYAVAIGFSRVVLTSHHPSDVLAGAVVGILGAVLVQNWFAARNLGFTVLPDGSVRALPGPSWRRMKAVATGRRAP